MSQAIHDHISRTAGTFNAPARKNGDGPLLALCERFQRQETTLRGLFDLHPRTDPAPELIDPLFDAWRASIDDIADTPARKSLFSLMLMTPAQPWLS